jgi:hypothetical protein
MARSLQNSIFLFFILILPFSAFSQKEFATEGEFVLRIEKNQTISQAKDFALQQAKVDGIERVFGRVIINGNSTYLQNKSAGHSQETKSAFAFFSDSFVKGEWIRNTREPSFTFETVRGEQWVRVKIAGIVREIVSSPITFQLQTLNCNSPSCATEIFRHNQDFFVSFKSPDNGYLALYLDDPNLGETSRILPYQESSQYFGSVPIKRNVPYIFFSKASDLLSEMGHVDELKFSLSPSNSSEQFKLFVLFSPDAFSNPLLEDKSELYLDRKLLTRGILLPKSMSSDQFQEWLQKVRINKPKLQVDYHYLNLVR